MPNNNEIKKFINTHNLNAEVESRNKNSTIIPLYRDPINLDIMLDPVILVQTCQTYDRTTLEQWFGHPHYRNTCPLTGQDLSSQLYIDNIAFRYAIIEYLKNEVLPFIDTSATMQIVPDTLTTPAVPPVADATFFVDPVATAVPTAPILFSALGNLTPRMMELVTRIRNSDPTLCELYRLDQTGLPVVLTELANNPTVAQQITDLSIDTSVENLDVPAIFDNLKFIGLHNAKIRTLHLNYLPRLQTLDIEHCSNLQHFDLTMLDNLPSLKQLTCCHGGLSNEFKILLDIKLADIHRLNNERKINTYRYHGT